MVRGPGLCPEPQTVQAGTAEPREDKRRGKRDKQDIVDDDYEVVDEDKDK
jgi:hypothetical protein